jgi:hypothetical protein
MPGGTTEVGGNTKLQVVGVLGSSAGVTTPSVNANTSTTTTYNIPGLLVNDMIDLQAQTHVAGLSIGSAWCAANGVVTVQFINSTGSTIGAQSNYIILFQVTRMENANLNLSVFPTAIV